LKFDPSFDHISEIESNNILENGYSAHLALLHTDNSNHGKGIPAKCIVGKRASFMNTIYRAQEGIMRHSQPYSKTVVAGALGECVHVAGVLRFLRLAEVAGWRTVFLGPAVSIESFIQAIQQEDADLVGISYRLTPETGERLLGAFAEAADQLHEEGRNFVFGGTPPVAERARALGFFERIFNGSEHPEEILSYLKGEPASGATEVDFPQKTIERIHWKSPYPILRHHFGLPILEDTIKGIIQIAEAKAIDVISLGIDQDAQEHFFKPEKQDPRARGAGGVPVRSPDDYQALYQASRRGNFPLLRTYSGTDDFIRLAEMYLETINNAWGAIPIFWFNQMDGRGPYDLESSIREHQRVMAWYGERDIPLELNEPHHWGMRDAHDVIFVVSAYLSAYNARAFGVRDYIAQMMFNSPPGHSDAMDLAKMDACLRISKPLERPDFRIWRQVRTGLLSYPLERSAARAHLATSIYVQMALEPQIVHIVGHTEADHAATSEEVIEAADLARRAIDNALRGIPDMRADPAIQMRSEELVREAKITISAIKRLTPSSNVDPLINPTTLAKAVLSGILDAPQLQNNPFALGKVHTQIDWRGACVAIDPNTQKVLSEEERIQNLNRLSSFG
jgi:methylmalonyl-CoA mutase cobalamin-binding subunit